MSGLPMRFPTQLKYAAIPIADVIADFRYHILPLTSHFYDLATIIEDMVAIIQDEHRNVPDIADNIIDYYIQGLPEPALRMVFLKFEDEDLVVYYNALTSLLIRLYERIVEFGFYQAGVIPDDPSVWYECQYVGVNTELLYVQIYIAEFRPTRY